MRANRGPEGVPLELVLLGGKRDFITAPRFGLKNLGGGTFGADPLD